MKRFNFPKTKPLLFALGVVVLLFTCYHVIFPSLVFPESYRGQVIDTRLCFAGTVTVQSGGRLGNQILEYLSAWSVGKLYNVTAIIPEVMYDILNEGFEGFSLDTIKKYIEENHDVCGNVTEKYVLKSPAKNLQRIQEHVNTSWQQGAAFVLPMWVVLAETIIPLWRQVKEELRFREKYRDNAQRTLAEFKKKMIPITGTTNNTLVFVGVHVRRTDYEPFLKRRYGAQEVARASYYRHAIRWLRQALAEEEHGPVDMIFVVVSDDIAWCTEHLIPDMLKERNQSDVRQLGTFSVFPTTAGGSPFHDLALLSACNHSILSYGTYGVSAALLAGGKTVTFDIAASEMNRNMTESIHNLKFVGKLPHWVAIY